MKRIFFILSLILLIYSCKKDVAIPSVKNNTPPSPQIQSSEDYYPLKKGNWWVYDYYQMNTSSGTEQFDHRDSVYIVGDTIINGYRYAYQKNTYQNGWLYLRDSSGYMLTIGGERILFSSTNFTDTLYIYNPAYPFTVYSKMIHTDTLISTPVGSFHSISRGYIWRYNNQPLPKNEYLFFGRGIGLTQYCHWYYPNCVGKIEGRLVKYHLN